MNRMAKILSALLVGLWVQAANAQQLVTGLTNETVFITSDFNGTELVIFGTINDMQKPAKNLALFVKNNGPLEFGSTKKMLSLATFPHPI